MSKARYMPKKVPHDLSKLHLENIVRRIQMAFWAEDNEWDTGKPWTPDTLVTIAGILCEYDLIPMEVEEEQELDPVLFRRFQESGRDVSDLGDVLKDWTLVDHAGRIYLDSLYIEDTRSWPTSAPGFGKGRWYTLVGNCEYQSDDLEQIEQILYRFALSEGYL